MQKNVICCFKNSPIAYGCFTAIIEMTADSLDGNDGHCSSTIDYTAFTVHSDLVAPWRTTGRLQFDTAEKMGEAKGKIV